MKYLICLVLTIPLCSQEPTTDTLRKNLDPNPNRLFMMSTASNKPLHQLTLEVHEFVAYQITYVPFHILQVNSIFIPKHEFTFGVKAEIFNPVTSDVGLAVGADMFFLREGRFESNSEDHVFLFFPSPEDVYTQHQPEPKKIFYMTSITASYGNERMQIHCSINGLTRRLMKYVRYGNQEGDWYDELEAERFVLPSSIHVGFHRESKYSRIKFMIEGAYVYNSFTRIYDFSYLGIGVRTWTNIFSFDFGLLTFATGREHFEPGRRMFMIPYITMTVFY